MDLLPRARYVTPVTPARWLKLPDATSAGGAFGRATLRDFIIGDWQVSLLWRAEKANGPRLSITKKDSAVRASEPPFQMRRNRWHHKPILVEKA